jgi:hypothetical protein
MGCETNFDNVPLPIPLKQDRGRLSKFPLTKKEMEHEAENI